VRILVISNMFPWPLDRGITQRIHYLTAAMAAEHEVTLVSLAQVGEDVDHSPLFTLCKRVVVVREQRATSGPRLWQPILRQIMSLLASVQPPSVVRDQSGPLVEQLRQLAATEQFDLVWAQRAPMAECARSAGLRHIVVDMADLDWEALKRAVEAGGWYLRRPLHEIECSRLKRYERSMPQRFTGVTVCKEQDREFLGSPSSRVLVVPNGTTALVPTRSEDEAEGELLFVGTLGYEPNVDACTYFVREVLPVLRQMVPSARLTIAGRDATAPVKALHDGVACTVISPSHDLTGLYRKASVVIAPIRRGAGTRLKVIEALAHNKAVVSTTFGAEGLDFKDGHELLLADTPNAIAAACARLLTDRRLRQTLGEAGSRRVNASYTWTEIGRRAERDITGLLAHESSLETGVAQ